MSNDHAACCHCQTPPAAPPDAPVMSTVKKTAKPVGSTLLSLFIAFFPKCPVCLAAYMSMFGTFSVAQAKSLWWLFPALLGFLAVHLFMLYKKIPQKGYGPFVLSIAGAIIILLARTYFQFNNWALYSGMSCILAGSLWNSFSVKQIQTVIS